MREGSRGSRAGGKEPRRAASAEFLTAWAVALSEQDHVTEEIELTQEAWSNGDVRGTRTYHGLRPQPGRRVREIVLRERATRLIDGAPAPHNHHVLQAPPVDYSLISHSSGAWREHRFVFRPPWTGGGELSFRLEAIIPAAYDAGGLEGYAAFRVAHACRRLTLRAAFAAGCPAREWLAPVAWRQEPAESLDLACVARAWSYRWRRRHAMLVLNDPLPGRIFALRWLSTGSPPPGSRSRRVPR